MSTGMHFFRCTTRNADICDRNYNYESSTFDMPWALATSSSYPLLLYRRRRPILPHIGMQGYGSLQSQSSISTMLTLKTDGNPMLRDGVTGDWWVEPPHADAAYH
jgi:hypothetical protein